LASTVAVPPPSAPQAPAPVATPTAPAQGSPIIPGTVIPPPVQPLAVAPVQARTSQSLAPTRSSAPPTLPLAQPAQAAARQDSIAPLLQNLAAAPGRLATMPATVADAAMSLLATRLPLDRGAPSATTLKAAVERSGVFLNPPSATSLDTKAALLQLRAGLLNMLEGGAIAAVAPVSRRPPPPLRDAQPRGHRADAPTLSDTTSPRDTARTLLHQTDAALSRLKLTQLASQPADAARAAMAPPDFVVELPMLLGHELGIAQLQVQRDARQKERDAKRGWRVRFAVSFSVIGEVGAQIALLGKTANVLIWADRDATADVLETMLPELEPSLAARGLTVGSVRLRRGPPPPERPASGHLLDETR
jgi:hypothetical protein